MERTILREILPLTAGPNAIAIHAVEQQRLDEWLSGRPETLRAYARAAGFRGDAGETLLAPLPDGGVDRVILGLGAAPDPWCFARAAETLPVGEYRIGSAPERLDRTRIALCWALGTYVFARYRKPDRTPPRLVMPQGADAEEVGRLYETVRLARDLVNTPSSDMGPAELQAAAEQLAGEFGAETRAIVGDDLLTANFPMVHAVGRASDRAPRVIELEWGDPAHPRVALAGKGVCFDSGGLDIKPAGPMRLMKKDMGGAANTLALARLIMSSGLKLRLHVVIPAVDNAISGGAFRPGDILASRKGLTVEIDNTDAEGRLVLGDGLARAAEEDPELTLDFATLTGAARVALGPQIVPYYTDDEALAADIETGARTMADPVWRMPLWRGYDDMLKSPIADLINSPANSFAGSIAAALFLQRFAPTKSWAHFDLFAWNATPRPGRPVGGEAQACLAAYDMLKRRYPA
jgi:leucyl aminopeptidase